MTSSIIISSILSLHHRRSIPILSQTRDNRKIRNLRQMNASERLGSRTMNTMLRDHEFRNRLPKAYKYDHVGKPQTTTLLLDHSSSAENNLVSEAECQNRLVVTSRNKSSGKSLKIANVIKEHVKGKLILGGIVLQVGGQEKAFKRVFNVSEGERLWKACQCNLFTTAGPISGLLFISTHKIAFCSNRSVVKLTSPSGQLQRFHYKVVIPLRKIDRASQSESTSKTSEKYLQVVTTDDYEFWFMGFLSYKKTLKCLQQAISKVRLS